MKYSIHGINEQNMDWKKLFAISEEIDRDSVQVNNDVLQAWFDAVGQYGVSPLDAFKGTRAKKTPENHIIYYLVLPNYQDDGSDQVLATLVSPNCWS